MRVLFVAALPPERPSMIGRILPLASAVTRAGHETDVLTLSGRNESLFKTSDEQLGFFVRMAGPSLRPTTVSSPALGTTLLRWARGRRALGRELEHTHADVVVLTKPQLQNTPPTLHYTKTHRRPLLLDLDDLEAHASRLPSPLRAYAAYLERAAVRQARAITTCSPFLAERARTWNPRARVELLPTGIDVPAHVPPARLRESLTLPPDAKIILYVGSLSISSGHRVDSLLQAFASLITNHPSLMAHLVLAGTGIDEDRLRQLTALDSRLSTRVHFLGPFHPPEDLALAAEADLLVDPVDATPVNEAKSSHRTMLALATGTPIVAGRVGVRSLLLPTALHADCLYDPADSAALSRALERALDPVFRQRFQEHTKGLIEQWTWDVLGKRFVAILEGLARTSA